MKRGGWLDVIQNNIDRGSRADRVLTHLMDMRIVMGKRVVDGSIEFWVEHKSGAKSKTSRMPIGLNEEYDVAYAEVLSCMARELEEELLVYKRLEALE
jgi:hypothetical protein